MKKFFTLFLAILSFSIAYSQSVENFSYTSTGVPADDSITNTSLGGNIWKRHSGTGTPIMWSSTGLTYTGYAGSNVGGSISFANGSGSREDINMPTYDSVKTGSVYVSFLLNVTASGGTTGDYNIHLLPSNGTSVGTDFKVRTYIKDGSAASTFKLGVSKGGAAATAVFASSDYAYNQTYLVVLKYTFNSVANNDDAVSAYIFSSGVPAAEPGTADIVTTDVSNDLSKVYGFAVRQGTAGTASAIIDGIRIADGWYNAPLPVALTSFNASLINNQASLVWNTANEVNVNGYSIEKSNNGKDFNAIGFVAAKNASSASYSYNDVLASGVNYYRLKITDKDASIKYSSIVAINNKQSTKLEVYPNPVTNTATLTHEIATTKATIKVVTGDGKNVYTQNLQAGSTQTSFDVSKLLKGNYVVVFENGTTRTSLQFVKQ